MYKYSQVKTADAILLTRLAKIFNYLSYQCLCTDFAANDKKPSSM